MPLKLFRLGTLLLVSLLSGLAFAHVLERPAKMGYDAALYITLQKSLYVQWGPPHLDGVLEPSAIAATGLLAYFLRRSRRGPWLTLSALFALLLAFPIVFFWLVAPANAGFLAATLPNIPADWTDLRSKWETGHAVRFGLQFAALALLAWSPGARRRRGRQSIRGTRSGTYRICPGRIPPFALISSEFAPYRRTQSSARP